MSLEISESGQEFFQNFFDTFLSLTKEKAKDQDNF